MLAGSLLTMQDTMLQPPRRFGMLQDQILRTARHWKCGQSNSGRGSHDGDTPAARRRTV